MGRHFRNATWSSVVTGLRAISGLAIALLAIRLIGVESYGYLAALLSIFTLYLSFNTSFFTVLVILLTSPSLVEDQRGRSETLASAVLMTVCAIALVVLATGTISWIKPSFLNFGTHLDISAVIFFMGLLVAIQILAALQAAMIEACGRLDLSMKAQLSGPFVLLVLLCFSYFLHRSLTLQEYVIMLCVSACVDLGLLWIVRRIRLRMVLLEPRVSINIIKLMGLLRKGSVLQATSLMNLFLDPLNKLFLNYFVGPVSVTAYDLAMKVIWGIQGLFGSAMRVFLHIAHHDAETIARTYAHVVSLIAIPALITHTFGALLLSLFGHQWVDITDQPYMLFYSIVIISNLGMILIMPLYTSLINKGDMGFILKSQVILALSNTFVSFVMIPLFGLIGAAIGLLVATIYNVAAIYSQYRTKVGRITGMSRVINAVAVRFILTAMLLATTLYLGWQRELGVFWFLVLFAGMFVIGIMEPLPRLLFRNLFTIGTSLHKDESKTV